VQLLLFVQRRLGETGVAIFGLGLSVIGLIGIVSVSHRIHTALSTGRLGRLNLEPAIVTKEEYDQIADGVTYEEVSSTIGVPGEEMSRSEIACNTTLMYAWQNFDGSDMLAMFQNDRLLTRSQFGLPP
jgi:hypothetical protein